jgi:AraC-like DNA-binding protein
MSKANPPSYRFSLLDYSATERLEAWESQYSVADFSLTAPFDEATDYRFVGYTLGNISVGKWVYRQAPGSGRALTYMLNRSTPRIKRDGLDHYAFNLRAAGMVRGEIDGRALSVQPGEILVVDQARPYRREIQAGDAITLLVARDALPNLPSRIHGTIFSGGISELLDGYLTSLLDKIGTMTSTEALHAEQATLSLAKALLSSTAQDIDDARNALLTSLYIKAKEYIRRNLELPELSAQKICKEIGISRSSLYRLFEPDGGVANYIRSRRLIAIHRALTAPNPRHRIGDLAYRYGFNSNTQLSRAFKQQFGHAPSEARETAERAQYVSGIRADADYGGWLAQMR